MIAIIKKELRSYFSSMLGYILLAGFVLVSALYYILYCVSGLLPDYSYVLNSITIVFLIMIPVLTMRLFADETRQKTDQLLFTSPVKIEAIVLGKYLSAILFFFLAMAITAIFPIISSFFGTVPTVQILASFVGYALLGAAFISIGLFISILTDSQIVAAFGTFLALLFVFLLSGLIQLLPTTTLFSIIVLCIVVAGLAYVIYDSTRNIFAAIIFGVVGIGIIVIVSFINPLLFDNVVPKILRWFSLMERFSNFSAGIFNVADIVYYITFSMAFIYLTINTIEKRRWK